MLTRRNCKLRLQRPVMLDLKWEASQAGTLLQHLAHKRQYGSTMDGAGEGLRKLRFLIADNSRNLRRAGGALDEARGGCARPRLELGPVYEPAQHPKLSTPPVDYLAAILPGLADVRVQKLAHLTPAAWAARNR